MLTIRLSRIGKKNKPMYRLIISEKSRDPWGKALEILGSYNPFSKILETKAERIKYWLGKGAKMSPTVNNLLIEKKIIEGQKVTASKPGNKKGEEAKSQQPKAETAQKIPAEPKAEEKTAAPEAPAEEK